MLRMGGEMRVWSRLAGTLGICLVAIPELFYVYGMRVEWNGNMQVQKISFDSRRKHYAQLEENRARQRAEAQPPPTPTALLVASAPAATPPARDTAPEKRQHISYWTTFLGPH